MLLEQRFSVEDDVAHIRSLIPMFEDPRYIRVEGKPLFLVYRATKLPEPKRTTEMWRREAEKAGLGGLFLVRVESHAEGGDPREVGFDCSVEFQPRLTAEFVELRIERRRVVASAQAGNGGARVLRSSNLRIRRHGDGVRWRNRRPRIRGYLACARGGTTALGEKKRGIFL